MGKLTTHVLDTAQGRPAAGMRIELHRVSPDIEQCFEGVSNADGRIDGALLEGDALVLGDYTLRFAVADYFATTPLHADAGSFLTDVMLHFRISKDEHYHVPLLVTPWSYSTYRGS